MVKHLIRISGYSFLIFLLAGCAVRQYTQVQDRVDQDITGNQGYLSGTPPPVDRSQIRKTRKHYVLEFSTTGGVPEREKPARRGSVEVSEKSSRVNYDMPEPYRAPDVSIPAHETTYEDYTVVEGDTLQKISKKQYDTYRKWNQIYEANKDTLSSPDRIKPGMVIRIPR